MEKKLKVIWTAKSLRALQDIYNFYSLKSEAAATSVINDIIEIAESITFPEQYQKDEILPEYRRMIVRHYKILYRTEKNAIYILTIFDTRQNPIKLRKA